MTENLPDPSPDRQSETVHVDLPEGLHAAARNKALRQGATLEQVIWDAVVRSLAEDPDTEEAIEEEPPRPPRRRNWLISIAFAGLLFLPSCCARGNAFTGRVVRVIDGDTVVVRVHDDTGYLILDTAGRGKRVRLAHIDAPELSQPHGKEAKKALTDLIGDQTVTVVVTSRDRYGRLIATIHIAGTNANHYLVATGHAWHYVRYSRDKLLNRLQEKAEANRQGLWAGASPAPPWNWRRKRRPDAQ